MWEHLGFYKSDKKTASFFLYIQICTSQYTSFIPLDPGVDLRYGAGVLL